MLLGLINTIMRKILQKLFFAVLVINCSALYSQTTLPGTIEVENGDLSQNNNHFERNIVGSGNGGTNNIVLGFRKTRTEAVDGDGESGAGVNGTIINNVTVTADGNYDFTFTYFKNSSDNTITINSTDATGGNSTTLASFTLIRNDASGNNTATTSSYSTQTVTGVALTTGINYITITNAASAILNLDNVIVTASSAAIPPTMTSNGTGNWNEASTWTVSGTAATTPSTTPTAEYDVVIGAHIITIPSGMGAAEAKSITCAAGQGGQLILRQNNTLTVTDDISFDKSNDGMILYAQNGNFSTVTFGGSYLSGKKTTIIKRLSEDKWTLVSSGLNNSKQFKTLDDSRNYTVKVGTKHAFGSYDDSRPAFDAAAPAGTTGKYVYVNDGYGTGPTWGNGIGWATKSDEDPANTSDSKHDVVFQGDLHSADVPVSLANAGFNLVGNPYPTYLYGNDDTVEATNNVLTVNADKLTEPTLWFWDSDNETWITKNQSSGAYHISPLQGFFVKTNAASTSFNFTEAMQTHTSNSDTFLKSSNSNFSIDLSIENEGRTTSTLVNYLENTTTSFDNGFDSSTFGGYSSTLEVYTHLLDDNTSKKLAIQSLPNNNLEDMIVPVGISAAVNSEISFTAETLNVPTGYKVFLEDKLKNTFTRLDEADAKYTTTVSEKITDGRFYIHTSAKNVLSTESELLKSISLYKSSNTTLKIVGLSQGKTNLKLYNVLGKQVLSHSFSANGVKEISLPKLSKGVYVVQLETETGKLNKKIVLE